MKESCFCIHVSLFRKTNTIFPNILLNRRDTVRQRSDFLLLLVHFLKNSQLLPYMILAPESQILVSPLLRCRQYTPQLPTNSDPHIPQTTRTHIAQTECFLFHSFSRNLFGLMVPSQKHEFHPRRGSFLNPHREMVHNSDGFCLSLTSFHLSSHGLVAPFITSSVRPLPATSAIHLTLLSFLLESSSH